MGRSRNVPVHYLRPNHTSWAPPVCVFADTETTWSDTAAGELHVMRLWHARLVERRAGYPAGVAGEEAGGQTAGGFAAQVDGWCKGRDTVWLYFHNTSFDLAVSRLPLLLADLGWEVTEIAADSRSPFMRLAKGGKHLTIADSYSWLPSPLAVIGTLAGVTKPELPANVDSYEAWMARCAADTLILSSAMCQLMDWWQANDLGRWSITGNQTGWNCFRHVRTPWRILIDPDPARLEFGRRCVYGGRRGVARTGKLPPGRYSELDFERAYTVIARDLPLPWRPMYRFDSLPVDDWRVDHESYGITAHVRIRTGQARWPVKSGGRVWYPVGEFWTHLAGPDIAEARRLGALMEIGEGWVHELGHAMRPWAIKLLGWQAAPDDVTPPVVKMCCKNWGRAVIGKWAQRSFTRVKLGPAPNPGWCYEHALDVDSGQLGSMVDIAGTRWWTVASRDADNAYPEIFAWVEAHTRVRLGRAMDAYGARGVVSWDTDGMICDLTGRDQIPSLEEATWPLRMREKTSYRQLTIAGPQHMVMDGRRRWSGMPASAHETEPGKAAAMVWPKLAWQMTYGDTSGYVRPVQEYTIDGMHAPGWVVTGGRVVPCEMSTGPDKTPAVVPWHDTRWAGQGLALARKQNTALNGLWEAGNGAGSARRGRRGPPDQRVQGDAETQRLAASPA